MNRNTARNDASAANVRTEFEPLVTASDARTKGNKFRSDIQGLRAFAVISVVLYHAGVPFMPGGYVGVDVFFVISGFLITSHILREVRDTGRINLAHFYSRRARRILPASFLVLVLSVVSAVLWFPPLLLEEIWRGAVATALYIPNVLFAVEGTNYLAESTPSLFQHYWSLGIEEQFYILWPLALLLGLHVCQTNRSLLIVVCVITFTSFVACVAATYIEQSFAFFMLPTRAWELLVGGALATAMSAPRWRLNERLAGILGWLGFTSLIACVGIFNSTTAFPGFAAAAPVLATAAVILSGATRTSFSANTLLSLRPLVFVGSISYSLYLIHWPALLIPRAASSFVNETPLWLNLSIVIGCIPVSYAMFRFVENPARNAAVTAKLSPRRTLTYSVAVSAVVATAVTGVYYVGSQRTLATSATAEDYVDAEQPVGTGYVPINLEPALREANADQPILYADGCQRNYSSLDSSGCLYGAPDAPRIALFGDSHAAQHFPALAIFAERNGFAIESFTKSSCPSVSVDVRRNSVPYQECAVWRDSVIERLNRTEPALVVMSNYGEAPIAIGERTYAQTWQRGTVDTLEKIHVPVLLIADSPDMEFNPSVCLSANLEDTTGCEKSRIEALSSPARAAELAAADELGVSVLDFSDHICNLSACPPIIGNVLVYRDAHHLTATFSAKLSGPLEDALWPLLPRD